MTVVSERFAAAVREHLVLSLVNLSVHPVVMGIFGPPGEGKTFQLRKILDGLAVRTVSISAADFESERAGAPGKDLLAAYVDAAREIRAKRPTCLVIDDIDTTVGEWENNTGTVNHQQVLAQLMHLADRPCDIERVGRIERVPIFVTGNDFGKLYPPLRRPGRMTVLHWSPTGEERRSVVAAILVGLVEPNIVGSLLASYPLHPVSFFAELRSTLVRSGAATVIQRLADDLALISGEGDRFRGHLQAAMRRGLDPIAVEQAAATLHEQHQAANRAYLTPTYLAPTPTLSQVIE
ncbi:AAA family ATPase [Nocardia bovistercoris]|uniref:AAA family ATPase n=1 Tax=Nocardia bovistercoris TaxID=2785916 RepID=A0A931IAE7_9NOCA|nr:AAA family ATPase [Nocardia bovistercoris]MBH0776612.1 AAA family ATPase [Nocardia bovistercoris]